MDSFLSKKLRVLDGGLATLIEENGFIFNDDPLWSTRVLYDNQEAVIQAHLQFIKAGADIIETCSYQGYVPLIEKHLHLPYDQSVDLLKSSVRVARVAIERYISECKADPRDIIVAGSIGSFGGTLCDGSEFNGGYVTTTPRQTIRDYYTLQAKTLEEAGADLLAFETVPSLKEAEILLEVAQHVHIPFWISFSCKEGGRTCFGEDFGDVVDAISQNGRLCAVGINCTDPTFVTPLLKAAEPFARGKPFVIYPNSGEAWTRNDGWSGSNLFTPATLVPEWVQMGAKVVGGCCRIGPKQIEQVADVVKALNK